MLAEIIHNDNGHTPPNDRLRGEGVLPQLVSRSFRIGLSADASLKNHGFGGSGNEEIWIRRALIPTIGRGIDGLRFRPTRPSDRFVSGRVQE